MPIRLKRVCNSRYALRIFGNPLPDKFIALILPALAIVFQTTAAATAAAIVVFATAAYGPYYCGKHYRAHHSPLQVQFHHFLLFIYFASCEGVRVSAASLKSRRKVHPSRKRLQP